SSPRDRDSWRCDHDASHAESKRFGFPTTGSWGMVKVQPTQQTGKPPFRESPQRAVGGSLKSSLHSKPANLPSANPPNGSWGMVKVQPTQQTANLPSANPQRGVGGWLKSSLP